MAIGEFEVKCCEKALEKFMEEKRPPAHVRAQLDLAYRISDQSVEIFEVRPGFRDPDQKMETPIAKATYVKSQKVWKVYWIRQDLRWHSYPPTPQVKNFEEFLNIVKEDAQGCFFG